MKSESLILPIYSQQSPVKVTKKVLVGKKKKKKKAEEAQRELSVFLSIQKHFISHCLFFHKPAPCGKLRRIEMPIMNVFSTGSRR